MGGNRTERINPLNGLRVLALVVTFVSHTYLFSGVFAAGGGITFLFAAPAWACMWVLFTLSGYLAGRGFASGRYPLTGDGVKKYYWGRLLKIWLPTALFIFLTALLAYPDFLFGDSTLILRCLPLSWTTIGGPDGIGATWFVFTIMWLYLLTPAVCCIARRLTQRGRWAGIIILALAGLGYRLLAGRFVQDFWQDYLNYIYTPPIGNLDLYAAGVLAAYNKAAAEQNRTEQNKGLWIPLCLCYLTAYYAVYQAMANGDDHLYKTVYSYFGPTAFLIATMLFVYTADHLDNQAPKPVTIAKIKKNPLGGVIDWFTDIGLEFYLVHSLVLNRISPYISDEHLILNHLKLLLATFLISTAMAYGFHIFSEKLQEKLRGLCSRQY